MQSTTSLASSSWEAFRLTSKSPSELLHTLGPHGVDELIRQMLAACWRDFESEGRTLRTVKAFAQQVFDRNMRVWSAIKKPSPAAFFEKLPPYPADGFMRQALVLCWMMMPRGNRGLGDVANVVAHLFQRNIAAWDEDYDIFTKGFKPQRKKAAAKPAAKASDKKKARKK
jgi:hypothetical protein